MIKALNSIVSKNRYHEPGKTTTDTLPEQKSFLFGCGE